MLFLLERNLDNYEPAPGEAVKFVVQAPGLLDAVDMANKYCGSEGEIWGSQAVTSTKLSLEAQDRQSVIAGVYI